MHAFSNNHLAIEREHNVLNDGEIDLEQVGMTNEIVEALVGS